MSTIYATRPDSRVNLGAPPARPTRDDDVAIAVKVTLTAAEAAAITGPGVSDPAEQQRLCQRFEEDWLSPSLSALGEELSRRAAGHRLCVSCRGPLVGSELQYATCGQCGDRAVRP